MTTDTYAGIPVRRNLFTCDNWQRVAEDLLAFQDAVQEALRTEEAGHVLGAIGRLKERDALGRIHEQVRAALGANTAREREAADNGRQGDALLNAARADAFDWVLQRIDEEMGR